MVLKYGELFNRCSSFPETVCALSIHAEGTREQQGSHQRGGRFLRRQEDHAFGAEVRIRFAGHVPVSFPLTEPSACQPSWSTPAGRRSALGVRSLRHRAGVLAQACVLVYGPDDISSSRHRCSRCPPGCAIWDGCWRVRRGRLASSPATSSAKGVLPSPMRTHAGRSARNLADTIEHRGVCACLPGRRDVLAGGAGSVRAADLIGDRAPRLRRVQHGRASSACRLVLRRVVGVHVRTALGDEHPAGRPRRRCRGGRPTAAPDPHPPP